ncbi:hypothetical protein [Aquisphaera giovannonii]|uniref:hypothetical protein n=1 Tax=Aquisphaera giovannonii TaxID=406548 RepID=UPI0011DFDE26|nr:hypothetical protein [Aquisphaera giovannonii]
MVLPDNALVQHPTIAPQISGIVKVSGFDVSGLRVSYDATDDTLSVGIEQPASQNHAGPVIAGDADNNGNSGTVNPAVTSTPGFAGFQDVPDLGGTEHMGIFLDFLGTGEPQIVAGFSTTPPAGQAAKPFQVATAIPTGPNAAPLFGTELPQFEGNLYLVNSINNPNLEFSITHFSQLYQQVTGTPMTPSSVLAMGAFGGSGQDIGISEAFFPEQTFTIGKATLPPPATCPPISPTILINPHEHRIIDTAHRDLVRVYVFGTSGFDVTTIDPATARLAGASPITYFTRKWPHSEFPVETFVFNARDLNLPPGMTTATFTASTRSGQQITSAREVLNIPFAPQRAVGYLRTRIGYESAYKRLDAAGKQSVAGSGGAASSVNLGATSQAAARAVRVNYNSMVSGTGATTPVLTPREVVSVRRSSSAPSQQAKVSRRLNASMSAFLSQAGAS